ncbi:MAG: MFS transporter, partial [Gammaproteobacteria bacterium]
EVMVSITCLEYSYTEAPKALKSLVMACYFLSVSVGNLLTSAVNFVIPAGRGALLSGAGYFWFFTGLMLATTLLFIVLTRTLEKEDLAHNAGR